MHDLDATLKWLSKMYREAPIGLCFFDRELRYDDTREIVFANPRFEQMFGYGSGELSGQPATVLHASGENGPEETATEAIRSLNRTRTWSGEIHNVKKDGTTFWCQVVVSTFQHRDYGTVWVSVYQEITERKHAAENLRQRDSELARVDSANTAGEMAWKLAHEINQPLTAIVNYAAGSLNRLRMGTGESGAIVHSLKHIAIQAERAGEVIRSLRRSPNKREPGRASEELNQQMATTTMSDDQPIG